MALNVSYNIKAVDKFSEIGRRIKDSLRGVSRGLRKMKDLGDKGTRTSRRFEIQTRRTVRALKKFATTRIPDFGKKFKRGIGKIKRSLLSLKGLLAGIGISFGFIEIIKQGKDFEKTLLDASAITGISGKQLEKLGDFAKKAGQKFGEMPADVVGAIKKVAGAQSELIGVKGALEKVTESALTLALAGSVPLSDATDILTLSMGQFKLGAKEVPRIMNTIAAGSKVGAAEIVDLIPSIRNAGVVAGQSGLSFEELVAGLEATAAAGLKGEAAGTAFSRFLVNMQRKIKGVNIKQVGFVRTIELLKKEFDDLPPGVNKVTLAQEKFGILGAQVAGILFKQIDRLKAFKRGVTGTNTAVEQAAIVMAGFDFKLKQVKSTLSTKFITLFDFLKPKLVESVAAFQDFLDALGPKELEEIAEGMSKIVGVVTKFAIKIGEVVTDMKRLKAVTIGAAVGGLVGGPVGAIAGGIVGEKAPDIISTLKTIQFPSPRELLDRIIPFGPKEKQEIVIRVKDKNDILEVETPPTSPNIKLDMGRNTVGL